MPEAPSWPISVQMPPIWHETRMRVSLVNRQNTRNGVTETTGTSAYIILGVVGLALLITVVWRLASRCHALPCPDWLRWFVELDNPFTKTNRAAFIVEHLALEPGMTVLDAGCGPGRLTIPLARQVGSHGSVLAMDMQAGMLSRTKAKTEAAGLTNVDFLQAGLGEGKLAHNRFDRAVLVTVLGEIPDRARALREIFGALVPGGVLSVTEVIFDPHFQTRSTVTRFASEAGFQEKAFFGNRFAYVLHLEKPRGG
jgi:2-polyprenyl-3-methyl-5-hydroxy-6-metoxy-1,4-benzoquinol methylase